MDIALLNLYVSLTIKLFFLVTPFFVISVFLSMTEHSAKDRKSVV